MIRSHRIIFAILAEAGGEGVNDVIEDSDFEVLVSPDLKHQLGYDHPKPVIQSPRNKR